MFFVTVEALLVVVEVLAVVVVALVVVVVTVVVVVVVVEVVVVVVFVAVVVVAVVMVVVIVIVIVGEEPRHVPLSCLGLLTCYIMSAVEGASPQQMPTIDHQKTQGPTAQLKKVDSWATGPSISSTKLTSLQASHVQCCSIDPFDEGSNLGEDVKDLVLSRSSVLL